MTENPLVPLVVLFALLGFVLALVCVVPPARRKVDLRGLAAVLLAVATVLATIATYGGGR